MTWWLDRGEERQVFVYFVLESSKESAVGDEILGGDIMKSDG